MALYLTESHVNSLLTMQLAIDALDEVFKARARGDAFNMPRRRLPTSSGVYNFMSASWKVRNLVGHKSYAGGRPGIQFHVMLYDTSTNELMAVIEANRMGQVRTGAASGVATRYMANEGEQIAVGIIGSGYQAETQLEAVAHVRNVAVAYVYSRDPGNRERFAAKMSERLGFEVRTADSAELTADADVICTITSSVDPVLKGEWIDPGTHINAAGNNSWMKRELDTRTVVSANFVAVDDIEQAKAECGELMRAADTGHFSWDSAIPIHDIVNGGRPGRSSKHDVTLFESQGIALEDIAVCDRIVELARKRGIGHELPAT